MACIAVGLRTYGLWRSIAGNRRTDPAPHGTRAAIRASIEERVVAYRKPVGVLAVDEILGKLDYTQARSDFGGVEVPHAPVAKDASLFVLNVGTPADSNLSHGAELTESSSPHQCANCLSRRPFGGVWPIGAKRPNDQNAQDAYDLTVLLLNTGARYTEAANIRWERGTINLNRSKVDNDSILTLPHRALAGLERRCDARPRVELRVSGA